jgi:transcriptional regulator with GAF, ATPase, and Fis domain
MPIPTDTMEALVLVSWRWPGNVRKLEHFIERSVYQALRRLEGNLFDRAKRSLLPDVLMDNSAKVLHS